MQLALTFDAVVQSLLWAMRGREAEDHTRPVTVMTLNLAQAMGIGQEGRVQPGRSALLHDIGRLGVPDGILVKAGSLTGEESAILRKHPVDAYEMPSPVMFLRPALDIPYGHHEKWDGTGYPSGLKGEDMPLAARIFSVVDMWDALGPDHPVWPREKIRARKYL